MPNKRYAVIDLGTNTFHTLVVEGQADGRWRQLFRKRVYVRLADGGIGHIGPAPFERALDALRQFREVLDDWGVNQVEAFGTAAMRRADNSAELVAEARRRYGISISIISGEEEARLIHLGVAQALPKLQGRMVVVDIGGGSVEFVIADNDKVYWSGSYPIGVAVLHQSFHHSDPMQAAERQRLRAFLEKELSGVMAAMRQYGVKNLVGASGTFDVLQDSMRTRLQSPHARELFFSDFQPFYEKVSASTFAERLEMENVPDGRADMIVVALELVRFLLEHSSLQRIFVSEFAMKDGILLEMLQAENPDTP